MSKQVQNFIDDARRFQRCSDHDLAISSLQLAQQEDHHKEHEIEIQKLFSLSYRKIGNYNMALLGNDNCHWLCKRSGFITLPSLGYLCSRFSAVFYESKTRERIIRILGPPVSRTAKRADFQPCRPSCPTIVEWYNG